MAMEIDDEVMVECAECCADVHPNDSYQTSYGDKVVCSDCVRSCERCGDVGDDTDTWCTVGDEQWCGDCTSNRAYWCDSCEEYGTDSTVYITDRGSSWCSPCSDDAYFCEDCDSYYADGCEACSSDRLIHDHNYRPDPIFHSTEKNDRLYFGIEIELEAGRNRDTIAEYANQLEGMELAYLKHDGSLSCGFEVVTHPMTHDFYKNQASDLWKVIEGLRTDYGVKSWSTQTCGLHIHISRTGFNGGAHMHRFLNLVYSNQALYEALAGRSSTQWAKFDDVTQSKWQGERDENGNRTYKTWRGFTNKIDNGRNTDRYSAVNTQNTHTLEMRIFRGSVNGDTVKSQLDLAHASVEYTRVMSLQEVKSGALNADSFMTYIESLPGLYPHLNERMARIVPTSVRLNGQKVSA